MTARLCCDVVLIISEMAGLDTLGVNRHLPIYSLILQIWLRKTNFFVQNNNNNNNNNNDNNNDDDNDGDSNNCSYVLQDSKPSFVLSLF